MTDNIILQWCLMFYIVGILTGVLFGVMFWIWLDEHDEKKKRKKVSANADNRPGDAENM